MKIILWMLLGIICFDLPVCMLISYNFVYPMDFAMSFIWGCGVGLVMTKIFLEKK